MVNAHFTSTSNLDGQHVTEHVNLLERASPVLSAPGAATDRLFTKGGRVTVFTLLSYCAANHFEVSRTVSSDGQMGHFHW